MTPSSLVPLYGRKCVQYVDSDRVPGAFGGVLPAGRGGPPERPVGELVDRPAGVLLEPVVPATLRTPITQARSPARFVRRVVLEVALAGGSPTDRAGAGRMPDLGQVPKLDPRVMAVGFVPVLAVVGVQGVDPHDQVRAAAWNP